MLQVIHILAIVHHRPAWHMPFHSAFSVELAHVKPPGEGPTILPGLLADTVSLVVLPLAGIRFRRGLPAALAVPLAIHELASVLGTILVHLLGVFSDHIGREFPLRHFHAGVNAIDLRVGHGARRLLLTQVVVSIATVRFSAAARGQEID